MILRIYFPIKGADGKLENVSDCDSDFRFEKSIIDDQIAEMASLNFTALELSLFSRKKQRSKKIKTLYNFSLRAKFWLRGGAGGQFPRNVK